MKRVAVMVLWWWVLGALLVGAANTVPNELMRGLFRDIAVVASLLIAVIGTATGVLPGTKMKPR